MPRRVLLMISSMRGGGSERQTLLLLRHLDRGKFSPELYVTERAGDLMPEIPSDVVVHSYEDAAQLVGPNYPGRILRHQIRYVRELLVAREIDVIYDRTFHMTMIAGPAAQRVGVPRVSTIVSPPEYAVPAVEKRFVWLKRLRLARAYRQSTAVIAVSRQAALSAENYYGLPSGSVAVIHNPIDVEHLRHDAGGEPACKKDDRFTIVCVGRMTEEKGHHDLVSAIELSESMWSEDLPDLRVVMIGGGPLCDELQARVRGALKRHQIQFLGAQSSAAPMIASADALVLPSHFEGMPNVVLEAMALGTPVVATRSGGTVELEGDQPTILWAQPENPPSLAEALSNLVSDRESAQRRAAAAGQWIQQHHDVRQTTRRIEDLLQ